MKLCPQCEFIYENEQSVCDMDGKELVYDPGPLAIEENFRHNPPNLEESAAITVSPTASLPRVQSSRRQSRNSAVAALAALIAVVLLFIVYYARTHQARSVNANQSSNQSAIQSSDQSTQLATAAQAPAPDSGSTPTGSLAAGSEQLSPASPDITASSPPSSLSISPAGASSRERMAVNPVSAEGSSGNGRASVIVWLRNGASIKADEAWERREGVWYRQAGVVTFVKRSQVRSIQRFAAPNARSKSAALYAQEKNQKRESAIAQNQPRFGKPEPVSMKKESRVTSLLKKTGRILKKPFQF